MRPNPEIDIAQAITELATGEALVSFLDEKGRPGVTQRVYVVPPGSQIGPITPEQRQALLANSLVAGNYEKAIDRESAYEMLQQRGAAAAANAGKEGAAGKPGAPAQQDGGLLGSVGGMVKEALFGRTGPRGGQYDGLVQSMAKSAVRSAGREIIRGVLGGILGRRR